MLKKLVTVQWNREKWMAILSFIFASLLCSSCTSPSSIPFDENESMKDEKQPYDGNYASFEELWAKHAVFWGQLLH
jgi:hypothetical protein